MRKLKQIIDFAGGLAVIVLTVHLITGPFIESASYWIWIRNEISVVAALAVASILIDRKLKG